MLKSPYILILRQFFYMSHTTIISAAATLFKAWQRLFYTRPLKGDRSKMVLWRHELCRPILVIIVIIHCSSCLLFCVLLTRHLLCFLYSAAFCYCSTPPPAFNVLTYYRTQRQCRRPFGKDYQPTTLRNLILIMVKKMNPCVVSTCVNNTHRTHIMHRSQ